MSACLFIKLKHDDKNYWGPLKFQDILTKIRKIFILEINGLLRHFRIITTVETLLINVMSLACIICLSWYMCGLTSIEKNFYWSSSDKVYWTKKKFPF